MNYIGKTVYMESAKEVMNVEMLRIIAEKYKPEYGDENDIYQRALFVEKKYLPGTVVGVKDNGDKYNPTRFLLVKFEDGLILPCKINELFFTDPEVLKEEESTDGEQ